MTIYYLSENGYSEEISSFGVRKNNVYFFENFSSDSTDITQWTYRIEYVLLGTIFSYRNKIIAMIRCTYELFINQNRLLMYSYTFIKLILLNCFYCVLFETTRILVCFVGIWNVGFGERATRCCSNYSLFIIITFLIN